MLHAWWTTNMDARRSISLLTYVAGCAVAAIGMAASPGPMAFGLNYGVAVGPILGAALGGYLRHRVSDHERAPLWALAYGASVVAVLVATFGMAVVIRPTALGIPGLRDAWSGLIMSGFLLGFVGALLWERDARRRRLAALALLAVWLIVGGIFARSSGDPWPSLAAPVALGGFSVLLLTLVVSLRSSDQDAAKPATGWR
jgi:hypothetical protein